ncbi:oxidoreductase [Sistotremastrum suecicum HHB10207 ss-3]|uniref:Oxidoreductase n=1 Tax=Sistotremastrum suecicum HHB10207 ss-3 TaxID=1314776 RepID=A0A166AGJ3_9AGAM|nr:oxidoreductase [Sistotremastrum suecicum HHB10207 ss-3]
MPQTVLITGCSAGGIGHELAKVYFAKGVRVFATARRLESMNELASLGIETFALDVNKAESIEAVKQKITEINGGRLDILFNNAGKAYSLPNSDYDMNQVSELFNTNVVSIIAMCKAFTPLLIASGHGKIVNMSSILSFLPLPFAAAYCATKAALNAYGDSLRVELKPFNIDVITIMAGIIKSNIFNNADYKLPENSAYAGMRAYFDNKEHFAVEKQAMPADVFARSVVARTLKSSPPKTLWAGAFTTPAWIVSTFLPSWLLAKILGLGAGLPTFAKQLRADKKQA